MLLAVAKNMPSEEDVARKHEEKSRARRREAISDEEETRWLDIDREKEIAKEKESFEKEPEFREEGEKMRGKMRKKSSGRKRRKKGVS
jgi:hypothetical protein